MNRPHAAAPERVEPQAIILFDGVCNLCNGFVNFVIDHDPDGYFRFAALQTDAADALLGREAHAPPPEDDGVLPSVVLLEGGRTYRKSTAALRIVRRFTGLWPLLAVLFLVPTPFRDAAYDWFARNRYDWFGKRDRCRVPTPELQERFL